MNVFLRTLGLVGLVALFFATGLQHRVADLLDRRLAASATALEVVRSETAGTLRKLAAKYRYELVTNQAVICGEVETITPGDPQRGTLLVAVPPPYDKVYFREVDQASFDKECSTEQIEGAASVPLLRTEVEKNLAIGVSVFAVLTLGLIWWPRRRAAPNAQT